MYYQSQRVNVKSRKKSCWMWKIEKNNLQAPGSGIILLLLTLVCAYPSQIYDPLTFHLLRVQTLWQATPTFSESSMW